MTLKNYPEPQTNADRIVLKAADLLDQDVWERVTEHAIYVRGVRITIGASGSISVPVDSEHDASILKSEQAATEIASIFWTAFKGAMARKRDTTLVPKWAQISNDDWERVLAAEGRRIFWRGARQFAGIVVLASIVVAGLLGGISSCVASANAARAADLNRVNAYGFRKGDFMENKRLEYPSDCEHNDYGTSEKCREGFEYWEKKGANWVNWDDKP